MIGAFLLRYKLHVYRQDPLGGGGGGRLGMFKNFLFGTCILSIAVLCCCFKAMLLVRILPFRGLINANNFC